MLVEQRTRRSEHPDLDIRWCYLQKRVLWPNFGWALCAADVSRAIIAVLAAACGLVKVFVRSITWTLPRRQSIKKAEALLQDLRPVTSGITYDEVW